MKCLRAIANVTRYHDALRYTPPLLPPHDCRWTILLIRMHSVRRRYECMSEKDGKERAKCTDFRMGRVEGQLAEVPSLLEVRKDLP